MDYKILFLTQKVLKAMLHKPTRQTITLTQPDGLSRPPDPTAHQVLELSGQPVSNTHHHQCHPSLTADR